MFNNTYISKRKANNIPIVTFLKEYNKEVEGAIFTHMHYHDDFEVLYICRGKVKMLINGNDVIAEDDSVIIINPYETHYGEVLSDSLLYYCIDFDLKFLGLSHENEIMSNAIKYINYIPDALELKPYISAVHESYDNAENAWDIYAKGNLLLLFYHLAEKITEYSDSKKADFEKSVIDYIRTEYMNNVSSADISDVLRYNHNYFCRAFKKSFGCTFSDYLNEYRIRKAQELLTLHKVTEVSDMVGFSNINYFSVVFKKIMGMSPSDYKKQCR